MKYLYDRNSNTLVITLAEGRTYRDSDEVADGRVIHYDTDGKPYEIELLQADKLADVEGLISGREVTVAVRERAKA